MNIPYASNTVEIDLFEDESCRNTGNALERGSGAG